MLPPQPSHPVLLIQTKNHSIEEILSQQVCLAGLVTPQRLSCSLPLIFLSWDLYSQDSPTLWGPLSNYGDSQ